MDDDDEQYLKLLLESNPSIYLDEIEQKLDVVRKVSVSMATISRFLRSRGFTWKATHPEGYGGEREGPDMLPDRDGNNHQS